MNLTVTPRRLGLGAVIGLAPVVAAAGYQAYATLRDNRRYPARGDRVDIGGRRLNVHLTGREHEGPTVLLEGGMSCSQEVWAWVQNAVQEVAPVVSYDRAGIAWSDPGPEPRTAQRTTEDLVAALAAADCKGPYVLVGHSYGGLLVRHFAHHHPDQVAGMVLVDSAHPEQLERSTRQRLGLPIMLAQMRQAMRSATFGVLRFSSTYVGAGVLSLPSEVRESARARMVAAKTWRGTYAEMVAWLDHVNDETRGCQLPPDCPLVVLTAEVSQDNDPTHGELQQELAALSRNSLHRVVAQAEHLGLVMKEDFATHVTKSIEDVLAAARTGRPLNDGAHDD